MSENLTRDKFDYFLIIWVITKREMQAFVCGGEFVVK